MLNRLPAYFLLLGLACQFGYAQRSGASFSILSESTGPLVADGNTTTTAFSQMGATEATQGTFSSATTGVTGTIGFLSEQSSSSVDPASSFTVSGGQSGAPYYQFIDGNGQTPDFTSLLLNPGKSYKFTASGVSNSHPFMIGESYGDMNSSLVNGGPLSGSGGSITVTMPIDFNGSLYYFCTNHSGMFQEFSIRRPTNLNPTAPLTFAENQPIGSEVGEFNATNPDANASLTYYMVSGAGDGNNTLFTLETNGTLKTATTFDYESNASTYAIRVQAKDEYNATVEGNFTITLTDIDEGTPSAVGDGLAGNPYQVATLANLRWLSLTPSVWGAKFVQVADINATDTVNWDNGKGFSPIGNSTQKFSGSFDGQLLKISNLYINRPNEGYLGLFGILSNAEVKDTHIVESILTGESNIGLLVGLTENSTITDSSSQGSVNSTGTGGGVGGLVGVNTSQSTISKCYTNAFVSGNGSYSSGQRVGGLVGANGSGCMIEKSFSLGSVTGGHKTGGLVGANGNPALIENSYSWSSVASTGINVGGFVGNSYNSQIRYCYSIGAVSASGSYVGGFIGDKNGNSTITFSYWNMDSSGKNSSDGASGLTNLQSRQITSYTSWDFDSLWVALNQSPPMFQWYFIQQNTPPHQPQFHRFPHHPREPVHRNNRQ